MSRAVLARPFWRSLAAPIVARDPARSSIELHVGSTTAQGARVIHLTQEEARRLASLILFQAARLDRPHPGWGLAYAEPERQSAV